MKKMLYLIIPIIVVITLVTDIAGAVEEKDMVLVKAGSNVVKVNYDYYIGKYEVTNREFVAFLNGAGVSAEGYYQGKKIIAFNDYQAIEYRGNRFFVKKGKEDYPVILVSWYGAIFYCNWLSQQEGFEQVYDNEGELLIEDISKAKGYRLATDSEWEYAARGGRDGNDTIYAGAKNLDKVAWYWENSQNQDNNLFLGKGVHPVGKKSANELGIYDMSGNVMEWIYAWESTSKFERRVLRGGSWFYNKYAARIFFDDRLSNLPDNMSFDNGFRITCTLLR